MWKMIYDPDNGRAEPLPRAVRDRGQVVAGGLLRWRCRRSGSIGTWVYFGLAMVLLTAGVQKIPSSLYDAARVDGAGAFREFFAVTLPALRGEIAVALTLTTIYALRNFDLVYITTQRRARRRDLGAGLPGLLARVRDRPGRLGRGGRHHADGDHLRDLAGHQPASRSGRT